MADSAFWNNQEKAQATLQEVKTLRNWVDPFEKLEARIVSALELDELLQGGSEPEMERELDAETSKLVAGSVTCRRSQMSGVDQFVLRTIPGVPGVPKPPRPLCQLLSSKLGVDQLSAGFSSV